MLINTTRQIVDEKEERNFPFHSCNTSLYYFTGKIQLYFNWGYLLWQYIWWLCFYPHDFSYQKKEPNPKNKIMTSILKQFKWFIYKHKMMFYIVRKTITVTHTGIWVPCIKRSSHNLNLSLLHMNTHTCSQVFNSVLTFHLFIHFSFVFCVEDIFEPESMKWYIFNIQYGMQYSIKVAQNL